MSSPEEIGKARDDLERSVGAETLLRILAPLFQDRLEALCTNLSTTEPKLESLLDYRSRIAECLRIIRELRALANDKQNASSTLINIFGPDTPKKTKSRISFWS